MLRNVPVELRGMILLAATYLKL